MKPARATSNLMVSLLVAYGYRLPDHPGKWRVFNKMLNLASPRVPERRLVVRHGQRWNIKPDDYAQSMLFWMGTRDHYEIQHLANLLRPGAVIVDAGANFGYHAATLARYLSNQCMIHALEPHPANFERLKETVLINALDNVIQCHKLGLSDAPRSARMLTDDANSGHCLVTDNADGESVELTTLDAFADQHALARLDAVLIDVEGMEDKALAGSRATLEKFKPLILVELWPPVLRRQGTDAHAAARILEDLGYRLYRADRDKLVPVGEIPTGDARVYALCVHKDTELPSAATGS